MDGLCIECTGGTIHRSNGRLAYAAAGASDAYPFVLVYDAVANGVVEES